MMSAFNRFVNKRPVMYYAVLSVMGILCSGFSLVLSLTVFVSGIIAGIVFIKDKFTKIIFTLISLLIFVNLSVKLEKIYDIEGKVKEDVFTVKVISFPEDTEGRIKALCTLEEDTDEDFAKKGERVYLYIYKEDGDIPIKLYPGGVYVINGKFSAVKGPTSPGKYNYKNYLLSENVCFTLSAEINDVEIIRAESLPYIYDKILTLRTAFEKKIDQTLNDRPAELLKGIMFSASVGENTRENFREMGISHVLAVSGLHVGLVYAFFMMVISSLRVRNAFAKNIIKVLSALFILLYISLSGFSPSSVRAAVMIFVYFIVSDNKILRGRYDTLSALSFAALYNIIVNPFSIYSSGFILSYFSVASIAFFYNLFNRRIRKIKSVGNFIKNPVVNYIAGAFCLSASVTLGILPVMTLMFGDSPLLGVLFNIIIVPLVTVCLNLGIVAFCLPFVSGIILSVCGIFLYATVTLTDILHNFNILYVTEKMFPVWAVIVYYILILSLTGYISLKGKRKYICAAFVIVGILYSLRIYLPEASVTFLDVGFGDAAIIRTEQNECIIIDGGGGFYGGDTADEILLPYFRKEGIRKIDAVISTHSDADHSEGLLGIIGEIPIDAVYANDDGGKIYYEIKSLCEMNEIPVKEIHAGDKLDFYGCEINILSPVRNWKYSSQNASSVVMDVELSGVKFLFMADAGKAAEKYILENTETFSLKYDFLKAPHHGTHFATDEFLLRLFTDNVIISVGDNGYDLPDDGFIYSMKNVGCGIFRTDECGSIKIIPADGGKYDIMNYIGKWRTIYESE